MAFWFVPVLRPNPNILPNKDAQDHYSSGNIPPLKIPRRAFFRPTFKQSSASQLSMVWPYNEVQQTAGEAQVHEAQILNSLQQRAQEG